MRYAAVAVTLICAAAAASASVLDRIPARAPRLDGYREDSVRERLARAPLHDVEGLWQLTGEGTVVAVERTADFGPQPEVYVIVAVSGGDLSLRPGQVMGYLTPAAGRGHYDARVYTSHNAARTAVTGARRFAATLSDDATHLSLSPVGKVWHFNWWRLLVPYVYRSVVTTSEGTRPHPDGLRRIYPAPDPPLHPRYL